MPIIFLPNQGRLEVQNVNHPRQHREFQDSPPQVVRVGFIVTDPLSRNFLFANRACVAITVLEFSKSTRLALNKPTEIHQPCLWSGRIKGVHIWSVLIYCCMSFVIVFFQDSSVCLGTHSIDRADLKFRDPPISASQALGLKLCVTTVRPVNLCLTREDDQ